MPQQVGGKPSKELGMASSLGLGQKGGEQGHSGGARGLPSRSGKELD